MNREQLLALLKRQCERAGSQSAWAKKHGVSAVYVSDVLSRRREPAGKILAALDVEAVVTYRRKKSRYKWQASAHLGHI